jgi:nucleotide-binding universal stress UspA family protein
MTNDNIILVPLDGSLFSEAAIPYAETLARATGRKLRLFGVVETVLEGLVPEHLELGTALDTARRANAQKHLADISDRLRQGDLDVETLTAIGSPASEIVSAAASDDVAMIIMATHGRGGADRLVIGSVADKVMRTSGKPTLLARSGRTPDPASPAALQRLMVPLDGSELAKTAVQPAADLALATGAGLTLVQVVPRLADRIDWGAGLVPELREIEADLVVSARDSLEDFCRDVPLGVTPELVVLHGSAAKELEHYIQEHQIDLTVMTTHGRGGFSRFVLGSTAERLIHSGLPVLLLHSLPEMPALPTGELPAATATGD